MIHVARADYGVFALPDNGLYLSTTLSYHMREACQDS
jgi:hypothetical protein